MRKFFGAMAALLICAVWAHAAAPTFTADDAVYEWELDTAISTSTSFDSLEGTADTVTLLDSTWTADLRWDYVLTRDAFVASGDSVVAIVQVDCFYGNNLIYSYAVDTCTAEAGEAVHMSFGGVNFGNRYRVRLMAATDNGAKTVINRVYMWRRRPVTIMKRD